MQINSINSGTSYKPSYKPNFKATISCDMSQMRAFCEPVSNGAKFFIFIDKAQKAFRNDKSILSVKIAQNNDGFTPENLKIGVKNLQGQLKEWGFHLDMEKGGPNDWVNGLVQTVNHIKNLF